MKKLFTLIILFAFAGLAFLGTTQAALIVHNATMYVSGDTSTTLVSHVTLVNNSNTQVVVNVIRTNTNIKAGHTDYFCWGINCFPVDTNNIYTSPTSVTIAANDSTTSFIGYAASNDIIGTDLINYLFYDTRNAEDTVSITISYDFNATTGINVLNPAAGSFLNCSQSNIENATNISYNITNFKDGKIVIKNLTGATVKEIPLNDRQGVISVSTSDMATGMYMYFLYNNNEPLVAKKQIIWHQ